MKLSHSEASNDTSFRQDSSTRPRVLICDPLHADAVALLRKHAFVDLIDGKKLEQSELEERIHVYHAVINRSRTAIPEAVIRRGTHLRAIVRAGVGLDNIDVAVAEELGITVGNCPGINSTSVAEHTLALMLGMARHIRSAGQSMQAGEWAKSQFFGTELHGKTLGIIGFGNIGRQVATRALAFEMRIVVNQNRLTPELASEWRVENVDLYELLATADFVSIHVPMRPANRGLIGTKELDVMKSTAVLINTSRGGIVEEAALLDALDRGAIAGAALDVFENEPNVYQALAQHPKVLATPHIGASTHDAQRNAGMEAARQVIAAIKKPSPAEALSLRLVPIEHVVPHEFYHGPRVNSLAKNLERDEFLANPPLVAELPEEQGYVVLDGATRTTAFRKLNFPHLIVQVVDMQRDVQLYSWLHAVLDTMNNGGIEGLMQKLRDIKELQIVEKPVSELNDALNEHGSIGYMLTNQNKGFLLQMQTHHAARTDDDWLDLLNQVVESYSQWGDVERTLEQRVDNLQAMYAAFTALFLFPTFTSEIVLQLASQGRLLPAGITRFVIPGRILRLNAPLEKLRNDEPLTHKQEWLDRFIEDKLGGRSVRFYEEPVILLDE